MKGAVAAILGLWLSACAAPPEALFVDAANVAPAERACYRTLGRVDCHARPLAGEAARRVGFFDWAALGARPSY